MRFALRIALLALSFGIGTWILGWWAVPLFAAIAAVFARSVRQQGLAAALAAGLAWAALLGWSTVQGSVWTFAGLAGGAMGVSGATLIFLTLLFPISLAWAATAVTQLIARAKPGTN